MADLNQSDIANIDRMFDAMDIDHDGEISIKELIDGECWLDSMEIDIGSITF